MGKIVALLCAVLVVCLVACAGEPETDEEQSPPETAITLEPPTSTHAPPTATSEPPTDTSVPPTLNAMEVAMTEQALTMEVATPLPTTTPHPSSCEDVEGVCLLHSFDGEECRYEGPTEIEPGSITLLFLNHSEERAAVNIVRHNDDKTIQDAIDYLNQEPAPEHHPAWSSEFGAYGGASPDNSWAWEGILEPGIYHTVCGIAGSFGFGTGITVED